MNVQTKNPSSDECHPRLLQLALKMSNCRDEEQLRARFHSAHLGSGMESRSSRTPVYSGRPTTQSESLKTLCNMVLRQRISSHLEMDGVPFEVLKPTLMSLQPEMLRQVELANPSLVEDADSLWRLHCDRQFRQHERGQSENWRQMFQRLTDMRTINLAKLTETIKAKRDSQAKAAPLKQMQQMANVKPPREVLRQVSQNEVAARQPVLRTPADRVAGLIGPQTANVVPPAAVRQQLATSAAKKAPPRAKKVTAPLMAKAMKDLKRLYRRS